MNELNISVENNIFTFESSDAVFTTIYIDYCGKKFPNKTWTDYTSAVLGMWTHHLLENKYSFDAKFKLYFMDGPFWMNVHKDTDMQLTIDCINARGYKEIIECTFICSYYDFLVALYDAMKSFNYLLYSNGLNIGKFEPVFNQTIISMREIRQVIKSRDDTH